MLAACEPVKECAPAGLVRRRKRASRWRQWGALCSAGNVLGSTAQAGLAPPTEVDLEGALWRLGTVNGARSEGCWPKPSRRAMPPVTPVSSQTHHINRTVNALGQPGFSRGFGRSTEAGVRHAISREDRKSPLQRLSLIFGG